MSPDSQSDTQSAQSTEATVTMTSAQSRFYASERCLHARTALQQLVDSPQFNTDSSDSDGRALGFIDRHLHYLSVHPSTLVDGYISNLKLMTRVRPDRNSIY